jgi:hypothetical protein
LNFVESLHPFYFPDHFLTDIYKYMLCVAFYKFMLAKRIHVSGMYLCSLYAIMLNLMCYLRKENHSKKWRAKWDPLEASRVTWWTLTACHHGGPQSHTCRAGGLLLKECLSLGNLGLWSFILLIVVIVFMKARSGFHCSGHRL